MDFVLIDLLLLVYVFVSQTSVYVNFTLLSCLLQACTFVITSPQINLREACHKGPIGYKQWRRLRGERPLKKVAGDRGAIIPQCGVS